MRFSTVLVTAGKTATGIEVPPEIVEALGASKRPAVTVTINDYSWRTSVAVMGGAFMVGVSAQARQRADVAGGDEVEVDIELDQEPREVVIPEDLAQALAQEPVAAAAFEATSYSNKRRLVMPIEDARTPETRRRRIDKVIAGLRGV
jgi:antitoxin component of MazEF toxin-antitoxin module